MPTEAILAGTGAIGGQVGSIIADGKKNRLEERAMMMQEQARREQLQFERDKMKHDHAQAMADYQARQDWLKRRYGVDAGTPMNIGAMAGVQSNPMMAEEEEDAPAVLGAPIGPWGQ
jgi:hypothetical protein